MPIGVPLPWFPVPHPELIVSRLFMEGLGEMEAAVFVGARRFSAYDGAPPALSLV